MTKEQLIRQIAAELQHDCHKMVDELIKKNPNLTHQDCTNVWLFRQLAIMKLNLDDNMRIANSALSRTHSSHTRLK